MNYPNKLKDGFLIDYISKKYIKTTPEEIESVQPLSKELVEDLGYKIEQIQTRPQFRIKGFASDKKGFPIDIALFKSKNKTIDNLYIIFECKRQKVNDGLEQLKNYLSLSSAELGVLDNGKNRIIIKKVITNNKFEFVEIPTIPKFGESINALGNYKKRDLILANDLKRKFILIRNYLSGNNVGITRDEAIAKQLIYMIFTKLFDEKHTENNSYLLFTCGVNETKEQVGNKIKKLWLKVKKEFADIFDANEEITLDNNSISYIVGELQHYSFMNSNRHVVSEAFETFIGHSLKGEQGQFFTPRNVIELAIKIANPSIKSRIIDPACGTGGFLIEATKYVWNKIDDYGKKCSWNQRYIIEQQKDYAKNYIFGVDKDDLLAKIAKAHMMLIGDGKSGIYNNDSLNPWQWRENIVSDIKDNSFDFVFTNPPFGSKIKIVKKDVLSKYNLTNNNIKNGIPPQILFIERCINLLKDKGVLAIILPDAILGNKNLFYIRDYLSKTTNLIAIISLPIITFMPYTSTKTSLIILEKTNKVDNKKLVFIATPKSCGHNRRGNLIHNDEVANVINLFNEFKKKYEIR